MRTLRILPTALSLMLFTMASGCTGTSTTSTPKPPELPLLVIDGSTAPQWQRLLRASGAAVRTGEVSDLPGRAGAVLPGGRLLSNSELSTLTAWLHAGGRLATSNPSVLASFGIVLVPASPATGVARTPGSAPAAWARPVQVRPLGGGPGRITVRTRAKEGAVLAATYEVGHGGVYALAVDPMAGGRDGHELVPDLGRSVATWGQAPAGPTRNGMEVYLDPGSLHDPSTGTPEALAARLQGVRVVHIAGWNGDFTDSRANYDYAGLIKALHARGILAYAWLEPPFVSLRTWEQHPECREKTQTGVDAHVGWRLLIALESPPCFALAAQVWDSLISRFDWDGVNLAELYFEPAGRPADHTPFSPSALAQFSGDPLKEPQRFLDFRTLLATRLTDELLSNLDGLPNARDLSMEVTAIDDTLDPRLARSVGTSLGQVSAVVRRLGASLQVEDPFTTWSRGPLRYDRLSAAAQRLVSPGSLVVDVNVVARPGAHPTEAMTAGELDLAISAAARGGRAAVYSLGTLSNTDLEHLPSAAAGTASTTDGGVEAPWSVTVLAPQGRRDGRATIDGKAWPVADGRAVVPAGPHTVAWSSGAARGPGLVSFTGELGTAEVAGGGMTFSYDSRGIAYAVLTCETSRLVLDGKPSDLRQQAGARPGTWVLRLPSGTHEVTQRC